MEGLNFDNMEEGMKFETKRVWEKKEIAKNNEIVSKRLDAELEHLRKIDSLQDEIINNFENLELRNKAMEKLEALRKSINDFPKKYIASFKSGITGVVWESESDDLQNLTVEDCENIIYKTAQQWGDKVVSIKFEY